MALGVAIALLGGTDRGGIAASDGSSGADREDPAPAPPAPPDACGEALAWVASAGLPLPAGVEYRCPSTQFAHHGTACWDGPLCRNSGFIAINLELMGDRSPEYLRHVVAHEVCHILEFQRKGTSSEPSADECAAAHGAPA